MGEIWSRKKRLRRDMFVLIYFLYVSLKSFKSKETNKYRYISYYTRKQKLSESSVEENFNSV